MILDLQHPNGEPYACEAAESFRRIAQGVLDRSTATSTKWGTSVVSS